MASVSAPVRLHLESTQIKANIKTIVSVSWCNDTARRCWPDCSVLVMLTSGLTMTGLSGGNPVLPGPD